MFLFGTWDTYVCVLDTGNNGGDLQAIVRGQVFALVPLLENKARSLTPSATKNVI